MRLSREILITTVVVLAVLLFCPHIKQVCPPCKAVEDFQHWCGKSTRSLWRAGPARLAAAPAAALGVGLQSPSVSKAGNDPEEQVEDGVMSVVLGTAVIAFAARCIARTRKEKVMIQKMWDMKTTVKMLREMALDGVPLPHVVLLRGHLQASGRPVRAILPQAEQLEPLLGKIDQPSNLYLDMADEVKSGNIQLPSNSGIDHSDINIETTELLLPREVKKPSDNLLVSELLVTRLGCEARKTKKKRDDGSTYYEISRTARTARFNVQHHRSVAEGLHIVGTAGEAADLVLPEYHLESQEAPSLFLSLPDPMQEFIKFMNWDLVNALKPFTHLSRFIFIDQMSKSDDGNRFENQAERGERDVEADTLMKNSGVLDTIAELLPDKLWLWDGKGFYDNNPGNWASFPGKGHVPYSEFKRRLAIAAEENAEHQDAKEPGTSRDAMKMNRDKENAFRIVELGISESDVTVLGKPEWSQTTQGITLVQPEVPETVDELHFQFRIMKGHTIDNLLNHRNGALKVYLGFAAMGVLTVAYGEEMIRNNVVIVH
eukprot:GHVU01115017.1.p1 GENE.GHVU01115017.1~~GHVU01115017.1.p1  ORF type:complete len:544 (+),score=88.56 GHVU01115017.1:79-1710(+)